MTFWQRICKSVDFWYLQYLIYTALYMCEKWEIRLFSILLYITHNSSKYSVLSLIDFAIVYRLIYRVKLESRFN